MVKNSLFIFGIIFFIGCSLTCRGEMVPRQRLLMDFGWKFSRTDTVGAVETNFNDGAWRTLDLPHDWSIENDFIKTAPTGGGGGYLPTGIGWYRKHFVLPKSDRSKNIRIDFDGVYQNSDVWINGHHMGHYPNGYMSFYYDISAFVKAGNNIVVVRVDNSRQPNTRFYSGSGIFRHVWLNITNPVHIANWGTYITTPVADSLSAVISIKTKIENDQTTGSAQAELNSIVLDGQGREVGTARSSFTTAAGNQTELEQKITISSPSLWSLNSPNLYTMRSEVLDHGKLIDQTNTKFGIRYLQFSAEKGFLLNGKHVKMNGVCLHHEAGSVGSAVPEAMWVRRLNILKEMGCNAIRTSHNPVAPEFLDLCDSMGFLVMDEIFDEWKTAKVKYGYSNYFDEWSQHDLNAFIHRDRNHPSVVIWSAGNEIGEQKQEKGYEVLRPLIETFHREDPTRPVTTGNDNIAADSGSATMPFLNMLDIVGYNYVDRWHERRELFYSIDRHDHPDWKMTGTESVSIRGIRGNYYGDFFSGIDSSHVRPMNMAALIRAEQLWKYVSIHDYVIGDFMWTGIDYLGESRWPDKIASAGVIDVCGFPKDAYYFYQSQWTEKPMIHLVPHWNWKGKEGSIIPVLAFTNCDSVELFLNGKSYGIKSLEFPRQGNSRGWNTYDHRPVYTTTGDLHLAWDLPYEPGTLKAVGRKNGKIVCEEIVRTTGLPYAIRLTADRNTITAGTRDVAHVKVEIVDENGLVVPDAGNPVQLDMDGPGRLIGFDNGNPSDHANMKSSVRKTFNGLALAIIQSDNNAGIIHIQASSPGIKTGSLEIRTELSDARPMMGKTWGLPLPDQNFMDMEWVGPGTFLMGSPSGETGRKVDEGAQSIVKITKGYWLAKTELTVGEWKALTGESLREHVKKMLNDETVYDFGGQKAILRDFMHFDRNDPDQIMANDDASLPMYFVSWDDAMGLCRKINERESKSGRLPKGYTYSLPTEAEWEYACRAGTTAATFAGPFGIGGSLGASLDSIAWYGANSSSDYQGKKLGNSGAGPRNAGQKKPNAWGLVDMPGNIWEWCLDWYGPYPAGERIDPQGPATGLGRVNRGGSWGSGASDERSANRASNPQPEKSAYRGFRIALSPVQGQ